MYPKDTNSIAEMNGGSQMLFKKLFGDKFGLAFVVFVVALVLGMWIGGTTSDDLNHHFGEKVLEVKLRQPHVSLDAIDECEQFLANYQKALGTDEENLVLQRATQDEIKSCANAALIYQTLYGSTTDEALRP